VEQAEHLPSEISITCELGLGGRVAFIDPERLRRAIRNIVDNSVEALTQRGAGDHLLRIHTRTRATARGTEIVIEDTGPGIPAEMMEKVREPLFTTKGFGTGLGIPAVEKIMELHGGGLELGAVPGSGARVTIWVPDADAAEQAA